MPGRGYFSGDAHHAKSGTASPSWGRLIGSACISKSRLFALITLAIAANLTTTTIHAQIVNRPPMPSWIKVDDAGAGTVEKHFDYSGKLLKGICPGRRVQDNAFGQWESCRRIRSRESGEEHRYHLVLRKRR